ncbi:hypothetical protein ACQP2F_13125 [Actinoplanes sp. CA-030573]|uniref:hypothetical protein n=1 Tax=Actinoplanes sp. CA-030573 TaxID=3239898 RepID=UPI003D8F7D2D
MTPRVSLDDLGAWLIKGNADHADLAGRFARDPVVRGWCVQPSYRTRLMRAGQPVVFWASGSRAGAGSGARPGGGARAGSGAPAGDGGGRLCYGVWGIGRVAGEAGAEVPLDLTIWPPARRIARDELRADSRLAGLEVFRQPQGSNPSYLTVAQFGALLDHLPADGELAGRAGHKRV